MMMMMMMMMIVDDELQYELLTGQAEKCRQEWTAVNAAYQVTKNAHHHQDNYDNDDDDIGLLGGLQLIGSVYNSTRWALSTFKLQCILTQPFNIYSTVQCNVV